MTFEEAFSVSRALRAAIDNARGKPIALYLAGLIVILSEGSCAPTLATSSSADTEANQTGTGLALAAASWSDVHRLVDPLAPSTAEAQTDAPISPSDAAAQSMAAGLCAGLCLFLFFFLLSSLVRPGYLFYLKERVVSDDSSLATFKNGMRRMVPYMGYRLLYFGALVAVLVVAVLPSMLVALVAEGNDTLTLIAGALGMTLWVVLYAWLAVSLLFGDLLVCLDEASPLDGFRESFGLARGYRVRLFVFMLAMKGIEILGYLALCVGAPIGRAVSDLMLIDGFLWTASDEDAESAPG